MVDNIEGGEGSDSDGATGTGKTYTHESGSASKSTNQLWSLLITRLLQVSSRRALKNFSWKCCWVLYPTMHYYQPEAYVLERFILRRTVCQWRLISLSPATPQPLLERNDVIVVASSLCIYGSGFGEYADSVVSLRPGFVDFVINSEWLGWISSLNAMILI